MLQEKLLLQDLRSTVLKGETSAESWQALIRKKQYQGAKAKTFSSKSQALLWVHAVEGSLQRPAQLAICGLKE